MTSRTLARLRLLPFVALALVFFSACSTGSGSGAQTRSDGSRTKTGDTEAADTTPMRHTVRDARIVLRQAESNAVFILVNMSHSKRDTPQGRLALSGGDPNVGYKPIADREIDKLLTTMEENGFDTVKQPYTRADERYLSAKPTELPGFKGIIIVENDGRAHKVVGMSPKGNPALIETYKTFSNLKAAVAGWYNTQGRSERPSDAANPAATPFGTSR
jgi:hypothetical protein